MSEGPLEQSEAEIIASLSSDARVLLKRVLEIERGRLHLSASDVSTIEDIHTAVRGVLP